MNICLVHEEYPEETNFGGIATYQKTLAEELVKKENNVYVICRGLTENKEYDENGVHIFRIFVPKRNNQIKDYVQYRKKVANKLKELQDQNLIDIIETPDWGAETVLFEPMRKVPLIVRLHTPLKVWLKYNKNNFGEVTDKMLYWEEKMLSSADYITCCSEALKRIIVNSFKLNKEIFVTPNPANIVDFYYDNKIKKENKLLFVGSMEERKGVLVLAKALNIVFEKYPQLVIDIIGKDTDRNSYNISTKDVIKKIIKKEYQQNLNFLGQIHNKDLNKYFNSSLIGIFPSLFDNFPYVVLESMATGLHVIGSKNSGMVEMLNDDDSIYKTGNYHDLAEKIINKYELSKKEKINKENIKRVKEIYNSSKITDDLLDIYNMVIRNYNIEKTTKEELNIVINKCLNKLLKSYIKEKNGVANKVYKVDTKNGKYIVKKYLYDYDFSLTNELYEIYENNKIAIIKPINSLPILYRNTYYNVFKYQKNDNRRKIDNNYLKKLLCCPDRRVSSTIKQNTINDKCIKYYNYLKGLSSKTLKLPKNEIDFLLNKYDKISNINLIEEKYINHGDISRQNIIGTKNKLYLIDFDETCIAPRLYDFAVIIIKMFSKNGVINRNQYIEFKEIISKELKEYKDEDYVNIIRYYLCKILLEKFYYHEKNKINLFSKEQLKDDYRKYLKMLKNID